VECFCLGKQKVVLFPTFRENGWVAVGNALRGSFLVGLFFLMQMT
jgi:hypothetical protein